MDKAKIKKIYFFIVLIYITLVTAFYFIAGEQLWYKESEQSNVIVDADSITAEINRNTIIEQDFVCTVDRLESLAIVFTKNYQEGDGILIMDLLDGSYLLARQQVNVKDIPEQHRLYLEPINAIEGVSGKTLTLRIYANSFEGDGAYVMMNSTADSSIKVNDVTINGTLCFSVSGKEELSTASYYWFIMSGVGITLAVLLFISYKNYCNGKSDIIIVGLNALDRYSFLIQQLVDRDFKTKYKRSVFGVFWSFLNPLLTTTVQFLVFSTFFNSDTENYPVYLIVGVVCFSFFNECTTMCLNSVSGNYRLITKVYIPKYIFPLSKTISSSVNLLISLVPLLLVAIITGTQIHMSFLLMFYFLACLIIFSFGIGMILATLMVFFRDIQFLWSVMCTIWQYATPIFYPAEIIPEKYRFIVRFNPLYHFIGNARKCLIDGISPEPISYIYCLIFALASFGLGSYIFKKCQDKFTLYL